MPELGLSEFCRFDFLAPWELDPTDYILGQEHTPRLRVSWPKLTMRHSGISNEPTKVVLWRFISSYLHFERSA